MVKLDKFKGIGKIDKRKCRVCGCTTSHACPSDNLCSQCVVTKAKHSTIPCFTKYPEMGQLWYYLSGSTKITVVILGNTPYEDGEYWAANNDNGEMLSVSLDNLLPAADATVQELLVTAAKCKEWAHNGNADAMWWLGYYYEYCIGVDEVNSGKKALSYSIAAFRKEPALGSDGVFERVMQDGSTLFNLYPTEEDLKDAEIFIYQFQEVDKYFNATDETVTIKFGKWEDAIEIAESL